MDSNIVIPLLSISLALVVTVLGWIIARKTEEIKIMRAQLSDRKVEAYSTAVDMFYSLLKDQKQNKKIDTGLMFSKMMESKKGIFLYGSDEVFRSFNMWLLHCADIDPQQQMNFLLDFILAIRKDINGGKSKLTKRDLLLNLTQNDAETNKFTC